MPTNQMTVRGSTPRPAGRFFGSQRSGVGRKKAFERLSRSSRRAPEESATSPLTSWLRPCVVSGWILGFLGLLDTASLRPFSRFQQERLESLAAPRRPGPSACWAAPRRRTLTSARSFTSSVPVLAAQRPSEPRFPTFSAQICFRRAHGFGRLWKQSERPQGPVVAAECKLCTRHPAKTDGCRTMRGRDKEVIVVVAAAASRVPPIQLCASTHPLPSMLSTLLACCLLPVSCAVCELLEDSPALLRIDPASCHTDTERRLPHGSSM